MNSIRTNKTRQTFTVPGPVFRKFAAVVPPGQRSAVVSELLEAEARKREKAIVHACMVVNEQAAIYELESDFQSLEDTVAEPFDPDGL